MKKLVENKEFTKKILKSKFKDFVIKSKYCNIYITGNDINCLFKEFILLKIKRNHKNIKVYFDVKYIIIKYNTPL